MRIALWTCIHACGLHATLAGVLLAAFIPTRPPPNYRTLTIQAGIGFTMSLFIAGQAFPIPADFAAAKIAVFAASLLSAAIGVALPWGKNGDRSI